MPTPPHFDDAPFDPDRLVAWVADHTGVDPTGIDVADLRIPPQTGFDSDIWFVRLASSDLPPAWTAGLVLRAKSDASQLERARGESALHEWLISQGYPVPPILGVIEPGALVAGPVQVIEEVAGGTMLAAATRRPWSVGSLLDRFAALHVELHRLPVDTIPSADDVVDKRLRLPRRVAAATDHLGLRDGIAAVEALTDRLRDAPVSVCHGDYHPLNVLVEGARVAIIDWTDGGVGDRHCDVARTAALFDIAAVVANNPIERRALGIVGPRLRRSYLRRYDALWPTDPDRITLWTPIHLLHDWSQALGASSRDRSFPEGMTEPLQARFEKSIDAVRHM